MQRRPVAWNQCGITGGILALLDTVTGGCRGDDVYGRVPVVIGGPGEDLARGQASPIRPPPAS